VFVDTVLIFILSFVCEEENLSRCVTKMPLPLSLTTDPVCARPVSQEMMLPGLSSHPLLDAPATRYDNYSLTIGQDFAFKDQATDDGYCGYGDSSGRGKGGSAICFENITFEL
jgi:hypothetical protein